MHPKSSGSHALRTEINLVDRSALSTRARSSRTSGDLATRRPLVDHLPAGAGPPLPPRRPACSRVHTAHPGSRASPGPLRMPACPRSTPPHLTNPSSAVPQVSSSNGHDPPASATSARLCACCLGDKLRLQVSFITDLAVGQPTTALPRGGLAAEADVARRRRERRLRRGTVEARRRFEEVKDSECIGVVTRVLLR